MGQQSYRVIRSYVIVYTSVITAFAVLIALPNIGDAFFQHVMGTPEQLKEFRHSVCRPQAELAISGRSAEGLRV